MNYFGLFFSFMVPGIIIGVMAAAAIHERAKATAKKSARTCAPVRPLKQNTVARGRLYVHSMSDAA